MARFWLRRGPQVIGWRARHMLDVKFGRYAKRLPIRDWPTEDVRFESPFCVPKRVIGEPHPLKVSYFSWDKRPLPEDWNRHPISGNAYPKAYWTQIPLGREDVKWAWEPARFDWLIAACRDIIPDPKAVLAAIRTFKDQCRPNEGVQWACGQETSFRMFALMVAATVLQLRDREAAAEVRAMLVPHAERIALALNYAMSQENNHGLSESAALFLAGHALPEHPAASTWKAEGKTHFVRQVYAQFTEDGWYAQHSHNYTRVALLDGLIALRVASHFGDSLPDGVIVRLEEAAKLLAGVAHEGRVPNYGANDGANVLPLHACDYSDFRPILAAVLRATGYGSPYEPGPWDELSEWFGLPLTSGAPIVPRSSREGGYYVLAEGPWRAAIRCHTYQNRPAQADMLHLDLWHKGLNLLRDGGTYSYNDPHGIGSFLKMTPAHNAITIDGESQMEKISQFMWGVETESKVIQTSDKEFLGEHYGYRTKHGVVHRRGVTLREQEVVITDDLIAAFPKSYAMNFRLGGENWRFEGSAIVNDQFSISISGHPDLDIRLIDPKDEDSLANIESTHYGKLDRTYTVCIQWSGETSRVTTTILSR